MNCLQVEADLKNIGFIEEFISTSKEIPADKRAAALIIATEVFDNIAEHAVFAEKKELYRRFFVRVSVFRIAVRILINFCVRLRMQHLILI